MLGFMVAAAHNCESHRAIRQSTASYLTIDGFHVRITASKTGAGYARWDIGRLNEPYLVDTE